MNELTNMFWNEHFRNINEADLKELSGIKLKVYNWLNRDNFGGFALDNNVFWIEKTCSMATLPNYIYSYLTKWAKRKGFTALYTAE